MGQLFGRIYKTTVKRTVKFSGLNAVIWIVAKEAGLKYISSSEYS